MSSDRSLPSMSLCRPWLGLVCCLLMAGCSSFHRDFHAQSSTVHSPESIEGAWEGTWKSDTCGHHGKLRGIVSIHADRGTSARFRATWAHILTGEYSIPIQVVSQPGREFFSGTAHLGRWVGGLYSYEGYVASNRFFSEYRCSSDHGTFQMERPAATSKSR